ncbi:protein-disulfide reductase DsbD [Pollutimonas harenae]|uniref:Thiol:disulfide interchange protein DsbD n=1 Tax=Pollutimonas harenae TaxID=657015 RepID=A0A853H270_9BURK|nr:protein-disulfide reductase DsbD [Pollutimonas harenae]NYT84673.1 protein-disulfide reductase DsbD [Pollutimonas harenae]TEA72923.1 protein-disulfide reductase DsbD [Pollutimonas harenae]
MRYEPRANYTTPTGAAATLMSTRAHARRLFVVATALLYLLMAVFLLRSGPAQAEEEFLDPEVAFVMSAATPTPGTLDVHFKIAPEYYMYRERFAFAVTPETASAAQGDPVYPAGIVKYDPTFEQDLEVYYDQVTVRLPLIAGRDQPFTLAITSQGCADAGLCYPPMTKEIELTPVAGGYQAQGEQVVANVPAPRSQAELAAAGASAGAERQAGLRDALTLGDTGFADYLAGAGWAEIILLSVLLGLLLSFTPCVLPMVPILLAILAGNAGEQKKISRWRGLSLAAMFVLGMSIVYTVLGVAAGLIGASLANWLQTPWVLALFALLLAVLALAMFDVFTLQAPTAMQSALNHRLSRLPGGRYGGVFLMGMVSALIVGPCVAAPLAGVLLFISQTGDLVLGGTALFAMAWGEGLLLLAVGATSGLLLPKAGAWMNGIKRLFGILLLATAWWMVNSILPAWLNMLGWALLALWGAAMLGAFEAIPAGAGAGRFLNKALGLLLALWAAVLIVGMAAGGRELLRPLAPFATVAGVGSPVAANMSIDAVKAQFTQVGSVAELDNLLANTNRPVMLDFYADWCVSCIEMEKFTFSDPGVAAQMSQLLLVQADVTKNTDEDRALLKRFNLFGPPGIIFFDAQGRKLSDARVVGFKNARDFGAVLDKVLANRGGATLNSLLLREN